MLFWVIRQVGSDTANDRSVTVPKVLQFKNGHLGLHDPYDDGTVVFRNTENYLSNYIVRASWSLESSAVRTSNHSPSPLSPPWTHPTHLDRSRDHCDRLCWWQHTDSDQHHEVSHWEWLVNICLKTAPLLELCEGWWAGYSYATAATKYQQFRACRGSSLPHEL